ALGLIGLAGCSNQPETAATNRTPKQPTKAPFKKAAAPAAKHKAETPKVTPVSAKATPPAGHIITVPKGTPITAIMDQTLHSDKNRSEERRVGKECRSRRSPENKKKTAQR